jgi:lipid A 3-O-deacylase
MIRTALIAAALLLPGMAQAQATDGEKAVFSFVLENDVFAEQKADRHYSNGFQFSYLWGLNEEPRWAERLADTLPPFSEALDIRFEVSVGQKMFTPTDLSATEPAPGERPYAGLAYATLGMVSESDQDVLDQLQILVGVVGPSSGADEVQRFVHNVIGAQRPEGWENQIADQFAWQLRWSRSDVEAKFNVSGDYEMDVVSQLSLSAGNLLSEAGLGASVRFGPSLPRQYGTARIYPSMPGSGFFEPSRHAGWYGFAGINQRYVFNDLTLDEPDARGFRVRKERWGTDLQLGVAVYVGDWHVAYTEVWRSRSFAEQRNEWDSFGALSLSRAF